MFAKIIEVRLEQTPEDWIVATSDDLPGLFISHPDRETVISDVPETIKALFKAQYGLDVKVFLIESPTDNEISPFVAVPEELIAQQATA